MIPKRQQNQSSRCGTPQQQETQDDSFRCFYCGYTGKLVWVHGHGQCPHCHTNIDECCRGESQ